MSTLEVRRHTTRCKPGAHLSQSGIELARRIGATAGAFELVVTSPVPRAVETAIAMGYEVHETLDTLGLMPDVVGDQLGWPKSFAGVREVVLRGGPCANHADGLARLWQEIAGRISPSGRALIVTHGGVVELGAVAAAPDADHGDWGGAIGYCEGVSLSYEGGRCRHVDVLRVPERYRLIDS